MDFRYHWYGWWLRNPAITSWGWCVVFPIVYKVFYIPGGFLAGFLNHPQYVSLGDPLRRSKRNSWKRKRVLMRRCRVRWRCGWGFKVAKNKRVSKWELLMTFQILHLWLVEKVEEATQGGWHGDKVWTEKIFEFSSCPQGFLYVFWCFPILYDISVYSRQPQKTASVHQVRKNTDELAQSKRAPFGHPFVFWGEIRCWGFRKRNEKWKNEIFSRQVCEYFVCYCYMSIIFCFRHGMIWPLNPPQRQRGFLSQPRLSTGQFAVLPPHVLFLAAQDVKKGSIGSMCGSCFQTWFWYISTLFQNSQHMLVHGCL